MAPPTLSWANIYMLICPSIASIPAHVGPPTFLFAASRWELKRLGVSDVWTGDPGLDRFAWLRRGEEACNP